MANRETAIRPYTLEDIPAIVAICLREVPKLPNYAGIKVDPERLTYVLKHNRGATAMSFECWVLTDIDTEQVVGGVAGYCVPGLLSNDLVANDVFMFIDPSHRSLRNLAKLSAAYTLWAKARNAKLIIATHTGGAKPEKPELMGEFLNRQGYVNVGEIFMYRPDEAKKV